MMKPSSLPKFFNSINISAISSINGGFARNFSHGHHHEQKHHEEEVFVEEHGKHTKKVVLNRPKALNALNLTMIRALYPKYRHWEKQPHTVVIMKGSGEKAFCSGGDIRAIYDERGKSGSTISRDFFAEEYKLNYAIARHAFTHIALLNGVTMGGGVGLSVHGKYRVATEQTVFAMPETAIGFFCDVGGSYFLSRMPNNLGIYLGLTGHRLKGADVVRAGVATHYVDSKHLPELEEKLLKANHNDIDNVLKQYTSIPEHGHSEIVLHKDAINRIFSKNTVEQIIKDLEVEEKSNDNVRAHWAKGALDAMKRASPTSLKVVLRQLHEGKKLSYEEVFRMEFRISQHFMERNDFFEGVRAALVDKDRNPKWNPKTLEEVSDAEVDKFFQRIHHELQLE